jgi:hypothetical protein
MKEMIARTTQKEKDFAQFLLILEDDTRINPNFFKQLPKLLDMLPTNGQPWSLVRFSTVGSLPAEDAVPGHPNVFYTRNHPEWKQNPKLSNKRSLLYIGSHAVLLQVPTVKGVLSRILKQPKGVIGIDMA